MFSGEQRDNFYVHYDRMYGTHLYQTPSGLVAGVSAESWDGFAAQLQNLTQPTAYIVSPELITVDEQSFPDTSMDDVSQREEIIRQESERLPHSHILAGTLTHDGDKFYNSAVAFFAGTEAGRQHKKEPGTLTEKEYLTFNEDIQEGPVIGPSLGLLICSDLISAARYANRVQRWRQETTQQKLEKYIRPDTKTLILMACWGIPVAVQHQSKDKQVDHYRRELEYQVGVLMMHCKSLEDVVVVDRAVDRHINPFNAHFKRAA